MLTLLLLLLHAAQAAPTETAETAGPATAATDPVALADSAVAVSPTVAAARARASSLRATASVAGTWSDPMLSVELSNVPVIDPALDAHPMTGIQFRLQQTLPAPGTTEARQGLATARAAEAAPAIDDAARMLRGEVETAYWRLALTRALHGVVERHITRTDELLGAVRARYEVGQAGQSAVLRLELLAERLGQDLADNERSDAELVAALRAALADSDLQIVTPDPIATLPVAGDASAWLTRAELIHPGLEQLRRAEATAQAGAHLAHVEARPTLTIWGGYRVRTIDSEMDDGTDQISAGLAAPLPFASTRRADGQETAALEQAADASSRALALRLSLSGELAAIEARWRRAVAKAAACQESLLPHARASLETTLSDYRVGRADFASLYDAEVALLDLERIAVTAAAETRLQDAAARTTVGGRLQ